MTRLLCLLLVLAALPRANGQAAAEAEALAAIARFAEGLVTGARAGTMSRSALEEGDGWRLWGFRTSPRELSAGEIRKQIEQDMELAKLDHELQREVARILPKSFSPDDFLKPSDYEVKLDNMPLKRLKRSFRRGGLCGGDMN